MSTDVQQNVLLPLKVHAFIFNRAVCNADYDPNIPAASKNKAKIAPITQPNYSFLRVDKQYLQSDILNEVDLHNAWPAEYNSRFFDISLQSERKNRQGVYIHWTLPRVYRSGTAATKPTPKSNSARVARNLEPLEENPAVNAATPDFPCVPTRWLVVRVITDKASVEPQSAWKDGLEEITGWVVESDRRWLLKNLSDAVDLQVDVSPFIYADPSKPTLQDQAEVFIGHKVSAGNWKEEQADRIPNFKLSASSNQLFADYQPHCSNVFSIVDNFAYLPDDIKPDKQKYLAKANASYYVIGWHSKDSPDPFGTEMKRRERLDALQLEIKGMNGPDSVPEIGQKFEKWLDSAVSTSTVCHGAMYDVKWNVEEKPKVPADKYCDLLNSKLPLGVGTTPMDALITYAKAHQEFSSGTEKDLESLLIQLEKHLLSRDDGVEAQQQALDLLYNWNFIRSEGGKRYHFAGSTDNKPLAPAGNVENLVKLNREQTLLDAITRKLQRLRWQMFSEWWKSVTDINPTKKRKEDTSSRVEQIEIDILKLQNKAQDCQRNIDTLKSKQMEPATKSSFYQQRDPTLLVGGIRSGWEPDYLQKLKIRLDSQLVTYGKKLPEFEEKGIWQKFMKSIGPITSTGIGTTVENLLQEFVSLLPAGKEPDRSGVQQLPLFHDQLTFGKDVKGDWRDRWSEKQPWFPLFLEWEVEYVHLDSNDWSIEERPGRNGEAKKLRYGIKKDVDLKQKYDKIKPNVQDRRSFSGRSLVLPQPSFNLQAKVEQLIADTPSSKLSDLPNADRLDYLQRELYQLAFLSSPLDGFTAHLTTLNQGSHVKPILRQMEKNELIYTPVPEAVRDDVGLNKTRMRRIENETDLTPYWTAEKPATNHALFKPVTHGQFKFTKLNIIDKFGQAIHVIDPTPTAQIQKVWPCISEWYSPQSLDSNPDLPNIVERDDKDEEHKKRSEYVQVPWQINQLARLNSSFVIPYAWDVKQPKIRPLNDDAPFWRPVNEWENPIWGWVIINYANFGIQLFLPDGTFYREVRFAGPNKSLTSPEWLPFSPPSDPRLDTNPKMLQLKLLVDKLNDSDYLQEFVGMINNSTSNMESSPDAYAEFTNALVGRPLALVNVGTSLELANEAFESHADEDVKQGRFLTGDKRTLYDFTLKLGDKQRDFDGLVGYFNIKSGLDPTDPKQAGDTLKLEAFYTEFDQPIIRDPRKPPPTPVYKYLKKSEYHDMQAYWIDPATLDAQRYDEKRNVELHVIGALLDPFSPLHTYSGILPVKEISLLPWTWQDAIAKMKAFFHAGPVVVLKDVARFNPKRELTADDRVTLPPREDDKEKQQDAVALPAMSSAQWMWLQPYMPDEPPKSIQELDSPEEIVPDVLEKFMALPVGVEDDRAKFSKVQPCTAIEGYLQMAGPPEKP